MGWSATIVVNFEDNIENEEAERLAKEFVKHIIHTNPEVKDADVEEIEEIL